MEKLPTFSDPNLLVGFESGDDAAVYKLNDRQALIFTVDFFPPVVDDPFSFGAVAAANSFSDVYAMGGTPICALNIVGFPADLPKDILSEIMRGRLHEGAGGGMSDCRWSHGGRPGAEVRVGGGWAG